MKNIFSRMSRRERLYLMVGLIVLFIGVVVSPAIKKAAAYRKAQQELCEDEMALLEDLYALYYDAPVIEEEHETLRAALRKANDLLFPPIKNPILTQTAMIKLFNELGPDLNLETTAGPSSVNDAANQMNLVVRGEGRYPEILKFMHRLETYRPLILIESFSIRERQQYRGPRSRFGSRSGISPGTEPNLALSLSVQIICQEGAE
jgi:hypothetical protein